jgi:hypothetical protein
MYTNNNQFILDLDGNYRTIDNMPLPLVSTNGFRNPKGAHLIRGR